jgi:hypothetical protein
LEVQVVARVRDLHNGPVPADYVLDLHGFMTGDQ